LHNIKRDEFQDSFKRAFERYLNDRLASWELTAKQELSASFDRLNKLGKEHQLDYERVVETMNRKLLGSRFRIDKDGGDQLSPWADSFGDMFFNVPDSVNQAISSFNTFWQTVLASICITIGLRIIGLLFTSVALNIFGAILLGIGTIALQAEYVRRQFLDLTKKEFAKYLPQIAEEQKPLVYASIQRCFDAYEEQIISKIELDLKSRQQELANLVEQKENREIDRQEEIKRLNELQDNVAVKLEQLAKLIHQ
ncbi:dynamin, partial [Pleurocapsales cyanobacterium LEGE 10410]|nr:dynamin [Pleurocapsales cyanobacterium LEGE 10410]